MVISEWIDKFHLINDIDMQIEILKADFKDLADIFKLQKECYITEAEIYNEFNIPPLLQDLKSLESEFENCTILKVVVDGEIIGSVRAFIDHDTAYIGKLIVKPDFQNNGIGKLLLNSIESTLCECKRYELYTGFKSQKNLYIYNQLGYKEFKQQIISNDLKIIYLEKVNMR